MKKLLTLSVVLEFLAFAALFTEYSDGLKTAVFVLLHLLACYLSAVASIGLLPKSLIVNKKRAVFFIFVVNSFIVVLGMLGTIIAVVFALLHPKKQILCTWKGIKNENLPANPRDMLYTKFGSGALRDILLNSPSVDRRIEAINSVGRLPRAERISFYKLALTDLSDDVRLLAYAQLDPLEQQINDNIKILENTYNHNKIADTAYNIAQQFWELCYLGLSDGVLFDHYIGKAKEWCNIALSHEDRASFNLLKGRICLVIKENDEAYESFLKAQASKMLSSQVSSYIAECAFNKGDYKKVHEIISNLDTSNGSQLSKVKEYWCKNV